MNSYISMHIIVRYIGSWIDSCETYEQLMTCEELVDRWILSREHNEAAVEVMKQRLQMQRLKVQISTSTIKQ